MILYSTDTLLIATEKDEKITEPEESIQDKIFFIFNNLSQANLQQKVPHVFQLFIQFLL